MDLYTNMSSLTEVKKSMKNNILKWGKLGPIFIYENIPVMPTQGLLDPVNKVRFKGGPIWPDWEDKPLVRHYFKNEPPVDSKPDYIEPEEVIEELVAWGGAIHNHYGHFIADVCIPRVIPILAEFPDIKFIFIKQKQLPKLRPWMEELFDYFNIKFSIIEKPTLVKKLIAAPQIERLNTGIFDSKYTEPLLNFLNSFVETKIKPLEGETYKKIFVSRAELPK